MQDWYSETPKEVPFTPWIEPFFWSGDNSQAEFPRLHSLPGDFDGEVEQSAVEADKQNLAYNKLPEHQRRPVYTASQLRRMPWVLRRHYHPILEREQVAPALMTQLVVDAQKKYEAEVKVKADSLASAHNIQCDLERQKKEVKQVQDRLLAERDENHEQYKREAKRIYDKLTTERDNTYANFEVVKKANEEFDEEHKKFRKANQEFVRVQEEWTLAKKELVQANESLQYEVQIAKEALESSNYDSKIKDLSDGLEKRAQELADARNMIDKDNRALEAAGERERQLQIERDNLQARLKEAENKALTAASAQMARPQNEDAMVGGVVGIIHEQVVRERNELRARVEALEAETKSDQDKSSEGSSGSNGGLVGIMHQEVVEERDELRSQVQALQEKLSDRSRGDSSDDNQSQSIHGTTRLEKLADEREEYLAQVHSLEAEVLELKKSEPAAKARVYEAEAERDNVFAEMYGPDGYKAQIRQLTSERDELTIQNTSLQNNLETAKAEIFMVKNVNNADADSRVLKAEREALSLQNAVDAKNAELRTLTAERNGLHNTSLQNNLNINNSNAELKIHNTSLQNNINESSTVQTTPLQNGNDISTNSNSFPSDCDELRIKQKSLLNDMEKTNGELRSLASERDDLKIKNKSLQSDVSKATAESKNITSERDELKSRNTSLRNVVDSANVEIQRLKVEKMFSSNSVANTNAELKKITAERNNLVSERALLEAKLGVVDLRKEERAATEAPTESTQKSQMHDGGSMSIGGAETSGEKQQWIDNIHKHVNYFPGLLQEIIANAPRGQTPNGSARARAWLNQLLELTNAPLAIEDIGNFFLPEVVQPPREGPPKITNQHKQPVVDRDPTKPLALASVDIPLEDQINSLRSQLRLAHEERDKNHQLLMKSIDNVAAAGRESHDLKRQLDEIAEAQNEKKNNHVDGFAQTSLQSSSAQSSSAQEEIKNLKVAFEKEKDYADRYYENFKELQEDILVLEQDARDYAAALRDADSRIYNLRIEVVDRGGARHGYEGIVIGEEEPVTQNLDKCPVIERCLCEDRGFSRVYVKFKPKPDVVHTPAGAESPGVPAADDDINDDSLFNGDYSTPGSMTTEGLPPGGLTTKAESRPGFNSDHALAVEAKTEVMTEKEAEQKDMEEYIRDSEDSLLERLMAEEDADTGTALEEGHKTTNTRDILDDFFGDEIEPDKDENEDEEVDNTRPAPSSGLTYKPAAETDENLIKEVILWAEAYSPPDKAGAESAQPEEVVTGTGEENTFPQKQKLPSTGRNPNKLPVDTLLPPLVTDSEGPSPLANLLDEIEKPLASNTEVAVAVLGIETTVAPDTTTTPPKEGETSVAPVKRKHSDDEDPNEIQELVVPAKRKRSDDEDPNENQEPVVPAAKRKRSDEKPDETQEPLVFSGLLSSLIEEIEGPPVSQPEVTIVGIDVAALPEAQLPPAKKSEYLLEKERKAAEEEKQAAEDAELDAHIEEDDRLVVEKAKSDALHLLDGSEGEEVVAPSGFSADYGSQPLTDATHTSALSTNSPEPSHVPSNPSSALDTVPEKETNHDEGEETEAGPEPATEPEATPALPPQTTSQPEPVPELKDDIRRASLETEPGSVEEETGAPDAPYVPSEEKQEDINTEKEEAEEKDNETAVLVPETTTVQPPPNTSEPLPPLIDNIRKASLASSAHSINEDEPSTKQPDAPYVPPVSEQQKPKQKPKEGAKKDKNEKKEEEPKRRLQRSTRNKNPVYVVGGTVGGGRKGKRKADEVEDVEGEAKESGKGSKRPKVDEKEEGEGDGEQAKGKGSKGGRKIVGKVKGRGGKKK